MRKIISTACIDDDFPVAIQTLYNKKFPWLTRIGPDGKKSKFLWIDIAGFNRWAALKGYKYRLPDDHPLAVEVEVREREEVGAR